jgi:precorrin-6A synthase
MVWGIMARELVLVGIGAGDPDWVTVEAARAIEELDVLFVVIKEDGPDELVEARRVVVDRYRSRPLRTVELHDPPRPWRSAADYDAAVTRWRAQRLQQWNEAIAGALAEGRTGGFLVWGDPSLYESTLAIVNEIAAAAQLPLRVRVVPGVSSVHALTARHRIPVNRQGRGVRIIPARLLDARLPDARLPDDGLPDDGLPDDGLPDDGLPDDGDDVVVMLDAKQTFATIDPSGIDIYWGAYLGTPDELLVSGPLAEVREEILRVRAEAVARKGWVFDIYLLRRT